jgi:hypothetical protein
MRLNKLCKTYDFHQFLLPVLGAEVTVVKTVRCVHILFTEYQLFNPQN